MWGEPAAEQTALTSDCEEYLGGFRLFISIHVSRKKNPNTIALVLFSLKASSAHASAFTLMQSGKIIIYRKMTEDVDLF